MKEVVIGPAPDDGVNNPGSLSTLERETKSSTIKLNEEHRKAPRLLPKEPVV